MPRDIPNLTSRNKDKLSRDKLLSDSVKGSDAADEFSKRKHAVKYSTDDIKLSKKMAEVSGHVSGRRRLYVDGGDNCFASEYDDFEDGEKLMQNSTHVMQQRSRNGLVLPGISTKHSLVDYDEESSENSDSSSESVPPQYLTGKTPRRKSSVQIVSASVKADLNDMRQRQSNKCDDTVLRHVSLSSDSYTKQSSSENCDERNDKKKQRHSSTKLPEPVKVEGQTKDIPVKSPKRRHSKDHNVSGKQDDKEYEVLSETTSRKRKFVDKSEKTTAVKTVTEEKETKKTQKRDSEIEFISSNVHSEKSKTHKKSKKSALSEEKSLDSINGMEQRSRTDITKPSTDTTVYKKKRSHKVVDDNFDHCKTDEKADRQKKISSHSDSVHETKRASHAISSVQQNDLLLKHNSDDHVHSHKRHEKEKRSSKNKSRAAEHSVGDKNKEKKDRSAVKHDDNKTGSKNDKTKDKKNKDKSCHSRTEREFSEEGQISSDSSNEKIKESRNKHSSHATLKKRSSTPVRSSHGAIVSSKTAVTSEVCHPER